MPPRISVTELPSSRRKWKPWVASASSGTGGSSGGGGGFSVAWLMSSGSLPASAVAFRVPGGRLARARGAGRKADGDGRHRVVGGEVAVPSDGACPISHQGCVAKWGRVG